MRILIVSQYFWPETFCISDLAELLVRWGHEVEVLTGLPNYPEGRFYKGYGTFRRGERVHRGVVVHRVPIVPRGRGGAVGLCLNYLSFVLSACLLGPFMCRAKVDAILVYEPSPITVGLPALLLKWLKGCSLLFWVQDLWPESLSATGVVTSKRILAAVGRLVRFIYDRCDRVLVQSRSFISSIEKYGVPAEKIVYFPNLVDSRYRPLAAGEGARPELPKGFVVMFAGNIGAAQDFPTILAAAEMLRDHADIHFVILGNGRMHAWVEENVAKRNLGATVHLLGRHPNESMPLFYAQADAMLVTLKDEPIFALTVPAKVQAYLACGRPVVAAIGGEAARIVEESGAGVACEAENPGQLKDAILTVYRKSEEERRRMGASARRYFEEHFDGELLVDRLEASMRELTENVNGQAQAASAPKRW